MSQFVVSARKYRPQRFDEIVGQDHVSKTLKNALQNDQLAHAFLFCGPRGVGKTTCARILAKVLNCENQTDDCEACNECNSCKALNENASFNINELDAASNNSVEHIRALIEQVRFQPQKGQYKIFIIDEVHMLSTQAFNAFLKTLEEPPPYAIFILATTEKHKIIPTILSRCQIFDFKRIRVPKMVEHLESICKQEGIKADKDALHTIAQKADGALRDALSIFDRMVSFAKGKIDYAGVIENLNVLDYDYYFRIVDAMLTEDTSSVLLIFDKIFKKGFDPDIFINGLAAHLRNLLVCKDAQTLQLLETTNSLKARYQEQAHLAPNSFILTALNIAADCDVHYKMARHKRLHVEMAIIKMTYIGRAVEVAKPLAPAPAMEKKTPDLKGENSSFSTKLETNIPPTSHSITSPKPEPITASKPSVVAEPPASQLSKIANNQEAENLIDSKKRTEPIIKTETTKTPERKTINNTQTEELESIVEATIQNGSLKRKGSKFDPPSFTSIELDEDPQQLEVRAEIKLEQKMLEEAWNAFTKRIELKSVKQSFEKAILKVKNEHSIRVEVGSQMAKELIQQEKALMPFLREQFPIPDLALEIAVDTQRAKSLVITKRILSTKEKYELMRAKNPLVDELRTRLDLKIDNQ